VLALDPAAYVAYMVPQYVLGPDYLNLAGDNERFFGLLLALFVLGVCGAITAWAAIDLSRLPASKARERDVGRVLLPIAAVLVFGRYAPALADWMSATPTAKD
jgi:H+/Cl- antiporter ClcA